MRHAAQERAGGDPDARRAQRLALFGAHARHATAVCTVIGSLEVPFAGAVFVVTAVCTANPLWKGSSDVAAAVCTLNALL